MPLPWHLRILHETHLEEKTVGIPGVRDADHPCEEFTPGAPTGDCSSDGHYMCAECVHLDLASDYATRNLGIPPMRSVHDAAGFRVTLFRAEIPYRWVLSGHRSTQWVAICQDRFLPLHEKDDGLLPPVYSETKERAVEDMRQTICERLAATCDGWDTVLADDLKKRG